MSLQDLPFPLSELSWDKLAVVQQTLQLSKIEAHTIMQHVLGPKDPWLIKRVNVQGIVSNKKGYIYIYIYCVYILYHTKDGEKVEKNPKGVNKAEKQKVQGKAKAKSTPKAKGQPKAKATGKSKAKAKAKSSTKQVRKCPKAKGAKSSKGAKAKAKPACKSEDQEPESDLEEQGEEECPEEDEEVPTVEVTRKRKPPIEMPELDQQPEKRKTHQPLHLRFRRRFQLRLPWRLQWHLGRSELSQCRHNRQVWCRGIPKQLHGALDKLEFQSKYTN